MASALDGVVLFGRDGKTFQVRQAPERVSFTAVVTGRRGAAVLASRAGLRADPP